jgi:hypothetical protein
MSRTPALLSFLSLVAASGCSSLEVSVDYDPKADFSALRTWAWFTPPAEASRSEKAPAPIDPLTNQRAREAVERALIAKGFGKTTASEADFLVSVHSAIERHVRRAPYSGGWGLSWSWGPGYAWGPYWDSYWGPPAVYEFREAALVIDVLGPKAAPGLLWRGVGRQPVNPDLSPQEREERVRKEVHQILSDFPPTRD